MLLTRRSLFRGAAALLAAPAIVRVESLMPVKAWATKPQLGIPVMWDTVSEALYFYGDGQWRLAALLVRFGADAAKAA